MVGERAGMSTFTGIVGLPHSSLGLPSGCYVLAVNHDVHGAFALTMAPRMFPARGVVDVGEQPVEGRQEGIGTDKAVLGKRGVAILQRVKRYAANDFPFPVAAPEANAFAIEVPVVVEEREFTHVSPPWFQLLLSAAIAVPPNFL
jgi:hypothetical protein